MNLTEDKSPYRLLILSPFGKDAAHLSKILGAEGLSCVACKSIEELVTELEFPSGAIITTEEILTSKQVGLLAQALSQQPTWSSLPVLGFYSPQDDSGLFRKNIAFPVQDLTEVIFLQRPLSATALISAVKSALRDRARQYRIRDLLDQLQSDIAEREAYEVRLKSANAASLEAQETAQNANHSKSQFLANMSHEIRTPLGAIMGFADLISQRSASRDEIASYVSVINRNSSQLLRIIDDILDLSKVEAGRMSIEAIEFSLPEMLADFSSLLGLRAREKGNDFKIEAVTALPSIIVSDSTRLRQILINIVGNAIKFTEKGSVTLRISCENGSLKFEVTDTGVGISQKQREMLFQPFVQADVSTTREFGGTGLGLVLTKRLCEAMGGSFVLRESVVGRGSTFVASVQVEVPQSAKMVGQSELTFVSSQSVGVGIDSKRLAGMNVLLVEDSPDNRALIRIILSKAGARIETASDGAVGVEKALERKYDVVLMDIQMPKMDGLEATRALRSRNYQGPIVALTAHAMNEERIRCMRAGFSHFLPKPVEKEALLELLTELGKQTQVSLSENRPAKVT